MTSTFDCTFEDFKKAYREFSIACPSLDYDGLENGFKALGLMYLGLKEEMWRSSAAVVLRMATADKIRREMELDKESVLPALIAEKIGE